jgi:hypothetical protein
VRRSRQAAIGCPGQRAVRNAGKPGPVAAGVVTGPAPRAHGPHDRGHAQETQDVQRSERGQIHHCREHSHAHGSAEFIASEAIGAA